MSLRHKRKNAKERMGYEAQTPLCPECAHCESRILTDRFVKLGSLVARKKVFWCTRGKFPVSNTGCCDQWETVKGETLDFSNPHDKVDLDD